MALNKETFSGTLPRWLTPILLALCVYFLQRQLSEQDAIAKDVRVNTTAIVVLKNSSVSMTEAVNNLDKISRLIEQRLTRLETKEEGRKP